MIDYDGWKTGWYEAAYERDPDAEYTTTKTVNDAKYIREALQAIVDQVYGASKLDVARLDDDLHWLASELGMKVPDNQPTIERKKQLSFYVTMAKDLITMQGQL